MITELPTTTIAHAIQLAVAPVFLLTGVASILSVLISIPIASLFVAAMLCLILALIFFIREIYLATANVRNGP
jgi:hypothetical protein